MPESVQKIEPAKAGVIPPHKKVKENKVKYKSIESERQLRS
jgi:hypothetical protein